MTRPISQYLRSPLRLPRLDLLRDATPLQLRIALTIIVLPTVWKLLSLDFSFLGDSCYQRFPYAYGYADFLVRWLGQNRCSIYGALPPWQLQVGGAAFLTAFVVAPRRIYLLIGIACTWLLDTNASFFRGNMYDIDTPLAVLTLVALTPVRLSQAASLSRAPSAGARMVALSMLAYVAAYYALAGLSKLANVWYWPFAVKLGNLYSISHLWFAQEMPPVLDWVARTFAQRYQSWPALDALTATVVLLEQMLWLVAPFSRRIRLQAGILTAGTHVVIALTGGIVFLTWPFIALAVTVPFSLRRTTPSPSEVPALPRRALVVPATAALLAISPAAWSYTLPPFYNYYSFGWTYPHPTEIPEVYALGWRDPATGALRPVPMRQGGFFEHRFGGLLSSNVRQLLTSKPRTFDEVEARRRLRLILEATREPDANKWLLGPFSAPDHLIGDHGAPDLRTIPTLEMLKGRPAESTDGRPVRARWESCGRITGRWEIERYARCRE